MRSGFAVFSFSISAPHSAAALSSSLAAIAAQQAAGSTGGTVPVSEPVATERHGRAAISKRASPKPRIEPRIAISGVIAVSVTRNDGALVARLAGDAAVDHEL